MVFNYKLLPQANRNKFHYRFYDSSHFIFLDPIIAFSKLKNSKPFRMSQVHQIFFFLNSSFLFLYIFLFFNINFLLLLLLLNR